MFTLKQIKNATHTPQASFNLILNPLIYRFSWIFINFTNFSPNFITFLSVIFFVASAYFFLKSMFLLGAICYFMRYLLDHVDGKVARLKKKSSKFGTFFDNCSGYIGSALCTIALLATFNKTIIFFLIPLLIVMSFIHPLQSIIIILFIKNKRKRKYMEFMCFEDFRFITFSLIPLAPYFVIIEEITLIPTLIVTILLFFIKQLGWMIYYYKEFYMIQH